MQVSIQLFGTMTTKKMQAADDEYLNDDAEELQTGKIPSLKCDFFAGRTAAEYPNDDAEELLKDF